MRRAVGSGGRLRLRDEGGFSLIELIIVMAILFVVLAGLTDIFTSGTNAEIGQNNRVQAQQSVRLGLDKFKREAHCASSSTASASSVTLTLPGWCVRTTLTAAVTINSAGVVSSAGLPNGTVPVSNTSGFAAGANTISFANSAFQTSVTCTAAGASSFTGCSGGGTSSSQTYAAGAIVTNTSPMTVTWCVPTDQILGAPPYKLERFIGSCGAASAGAPWATNLVSLSLFSWSAFSMNTISCAASGGTLTPGTYTYVVTAILAGGAEMPGVSAVASCGSGTTNSVSLGWSTLSGATGYRVYGRGDANGVRLLASLSSASTTYTDTGPLVTYITDNPLTMPNGTIDVQSTTGFSSGTNLITFGPSGPVTCTGIGGGGTSFTGCTGGQSGQYPVLTAVYGLSTVRPPNLVLSVTLTANKTRGATATTKQGRFILTDNVALRNSRPL